MHILTVGAHPDNPEIYAFGKLAAWAAMGARLTGLPTGRSLVVMTRLPGLRAQTT